MKRDEDFLRELLMKTEADSEWFVLVSATHGSTPDESKEYYHMQLLCDAGLMIQISEGGYRMTNMGHDYLAAIRSDPIWTKTKVAAGKLGGVTLGIMKDLAVAYLKEEARTKLGIDLS